MKLGIILTATIKPNVTGGNFSTEERMGMYASTLRYYAGEIGKQYPIILLENSTANLSALKSEFTEKLNLTILQFRPNDSSAYEDFNPSKGKGYNEYLM